MTKTNSVRLALFCLAVVVVLGGLTLLPGSFYISRHEGDTLHLMEILFRMAAGETPHRDFMTPIGALAFAPMVLMVTAGAGVGTAMLGGQVLMGLAILPAVWWVARTRLTALPAVIFCLVALSLTVAVVDGGVNRSISISMHYNRWAWALAYVAVALAVLRPRGTARPGMDGVVAGLTMAALAMIKATYFVCFAPVVVLGLILTGQRRALLVALGTGLVVLAGLTLWLGPGYWGAYLGDLLTTALSDTRSQPGEDLSVVISGPATLGASLTALAGVILLRQSGRREEGLLLLLLVPAFFYVTFQNSGNDPQWLPLLGVLLLALRPSAEEARRNGFGWDMAQATAMGAVAAFAFAAPSVFNTVYSPFRHLAIDHASYDPLLPRGGRDMDLLGADIRVMRIDGRIALEDAIPALETYGAEGNREAPSVFMGETFTYCSLELGLTSMMDAIVQDLEAAGYAGDGRTLFAADLFSSYWMFGAFDPLAGGAPWIYAGLPGYDNADYLLLPLCPVDPPAQVRVLDRITARGTEDLTEVRRTPLYVLYEKSSPAATPSR